MPSTRQDVRTLLWMALRRTRVSPSSDSSPSNSAPSIVDGYSVIPYEDIILLMDVQTMENTARTQPDGTDSVQRLKVFCDSEILTEDRHSRQKADRLWFQGKWFDCQSARLSENTPLRHWTATFVECADQDEPPESSTFEGGESAE